MIDLELAHYRLLLAAMTFLAAAHAYRKVSPFFAITWFFAGLVFTWFWSRGSGRPEVLLLPPLVFYMGAAATKGLIESRSRFAGNHVVHVFGTGLFSGAFALPFVTSAEAMGWSLPASGAFLHWAAAGLVFYGVYKILDHIGIGAALQVVLLFLSMPAVAGLVDMVHDAL